METPERFKGYEYTNQMVINSPESKRIKYFSVRRGFSVYSNKQSDITLGDISVRFDGEEYNSIAAGSVFSWYDNDREPNVRLGNNELLPYAKKVSPGAVIPWTGDFSRANASLLITDAVNAPNSFHILALKPIVRGDTIVIFKPGHNVIECIVTPVKRKSSQRSPPEEKLPEKIQATESLLKITKMVTQEDRSPDFFEAETEDNPIVSEPEIMKEFKSPDVIWNTLLQNMSEANQLITNSVSKFTTSFPVRDDSPDAYESDLPNNFKWTSPIVRKTQPVSPYRSPQQKSPEEKIKEANEEQQLKTVIEKLEKSPLVITTFPNPITTPTGPEEQIRAKSLWQNTFESLEDIVDLGNMFETPPPNQEQLEEVELALFQEQTNEVEKEVTFEPRDVEKQVIDLTLDNEEKNAQLNTDLNEKSVGKKILEKRQSAEEFSEIALEDMDVVISNNVSGLSTQKEMAGDFVRESLVPDLQVIRVSLTPEKPTGHPMPMIFTEEQAEEYARKKNMASQTIDQESKEIAREADIYEKLIEGQKSNIKSSRPKRATRKSDTRDIASIRTTLKSIYRFENEDPLTSGARIVLRLIGTKDRADLVCRIRESNKILMASGNGSYQSLNFESVKKTLMCMAHYFRMDRHSRFIDLGSGYGNIVFQAGLMFNLSAAHGVDIGIMGAGITTEEGLIIPINKISYYASVLNKYKAMELPEVREDAKKILFYCMDVKDLSLLDYTHIISFNTLWDMGDLKHVFKQLTTRQSKLAVFACTKKIETLHPRAMGPNVSESDYKDDENWISVAKLMLKSRGQIKVKGESGENFTMYFYVKFDEVQNYPSFDQEDFDNKWIEWKQLKDAKIGDNKYMFKLDQTQEKGTSFSQSRKGVEVFRNRKHRRLTKTMLKP